MRHLKTWLLWLDTISPMQKTVTNFTGQDRQMMAEALARACPDGPERGFKCVDECDCHGAVMTKQAMLLYAELHAHLIDHDPDILLRMLRDAITIDRGSDPPRDLPIAELIEADHLIGARTENIAAARNRFPRTWDVVQSFHRKTSIVR